MSRDYNFGALSPTDFEELVADLLSEEHGSRYEIFGVGADGGIDLRSILNDSYTIVQAKHYSRSTRGPSLHLYFGAAYCGKAPRRNLLCAGKAAIYIQGQLSLRVH